MSDAVDRDRIALQNMAVLDRIRRSARAAFSASSDSAAASLDALLQLELGRELARLQREVREEMPENPACNGFKVYSQADEDGIIEDIARRIGVDDGHFIEIGCGDGRENNTHYLLLKGWRGIWVDGNPGNLAAIRAALPLEGRLRAVEMMVNRDNVVDIPVAVGKPTFGALDLLSVDIDGNDLAVARAAVDAWAPKILVAEYNAKFPWPLCTEVAYDVEHRWAMDDYHGASLGALVTRLRPNYQLVCCNLAGTNAFFIRHDLAEHFQPYPAARLYQQARFYLTAIRPGHPASLAFLRGALLSDQR